MLSALYNLARRTFHYLVPSVGTRSVLIGAHCFFLHPWFVAAAWTRLYGFPWDPRLWFAFFLHDLGYLGKKNMDGEEKGGGEEHPYLGARIMHFLFDRVDYRWFDAVDPRMNAFSLYPHKWKPSKTFDALWRDPTDPRQNPYGPDSARIVRWKLPKLPPTKDPLEQMGAWTRGKVLVAIRRHRWSYFMTLHSRFLAKRLNLHTSPLCVADKLAIVLTPAELYLPMTRFTGELDEYMSNTNFRISASKYATDAFTTGELLDLQSGVAWWWYRGMQNYVRRWVETHKDGSADTWTGNSSESGTCTTLTPDEPEGQKEGK